MTHTQTDPAVQGPSTGGQTLHTRAALAPNLQTKAFWPKFSISPDLYCKEAENPASISPQPRMDTHSSSETCHRPTAPGAKKYKIKHGP